MWHLSPFTRGETEARVQELSSQHKPAALCPQSDAVLPAMLPTFPPATGKAGAAPSPWEGGWEAAAGCECRARGSSCARLLQQQFQLRTSLSSSCCQGLLEGAKARGDGTACHPAALRLPAPTRGFAIPWSEPGPRSLPGLGSSFPLTWRASPCNATPLAPQIALMTKTPIYSKEKASHSLRRTCHSEHLPFVCTENGNLCCWK